ncbi:hypothetical protein AUEXF2481DRAFT_501837 [Aureobasidium subglaciale EXF-2481]|uniref:Uncharacterized protein n=1 Tax=Aureobasidium subglaciale (strain EXF-2481) TaxID=1043005 RepID=A0A074YB42_AURSE|nr:uncharacterized protein AUEXF2481DRAFT_501837 [Aureobasidium subglaciale EXF-2481]KEQ91382.1 hypothetical protein AUEXF2481DRAFT_501837 [Aureobasidium subglaciale EXF-2481]
MSHSFILPILCYLHVVLILAYSHKPFDQSPLPPSPIFRPKKPCISPHPVPSPPRHIPSPSPQNPPPLPPPRHHHAPDPKPSHRKTTDLLLHRPAHAQQTVVLYRIVDIFAYLHMTNFHLLRKVLGVAGDARRGEILENVASPRSGILTATTCQGLKDFISGGMDRG